MDPAKSMRRWKGVIPSPALDATLEQNHKWDTMVAEKLLKVSVAFEKIHGNCRETNEKFDALQRDTLVKGQAYATASETIEKWVERPNLINVWELSAPRLYKCAEEGMLLYPESSQNYLDKLAEKIRMDMIYDAVKRLKEIEAKRPIKPHEIHAESVRVSELAEKQHVRFDALEERRKLELETIGDGRELVPDLAALVRSGRETGCMVLRDQGLKCMVPDLFDIEWLELLDMETNLIGEILPEIGNMKKLKKIYLGENKIQRVPTEITKLHKILQVVALGENPLDEDVSKPYLEGLPSLIGFLEREKKRLRTEAINASNAAAELKKDDTSSTGPQ